jgi:hypothetical protein
MASQADIDQMKKDLQETLDDMTKDKTIVAGWDTYTDSLRQQIVDLLTTNGVPPEVIAQAATLVQLSRDNSAALAAATAKNVPGVPQVPVPPVV